MTGVGPHSAPPGFLSLTAGAPGPPRRAAVQTELTACRREQHLVPSRLQHRVVILTATPLGGGGSRK